MCKIPKSSLHGSVNSSHIGVVCNGDENGSGGWRCCSHRQWWNAVRIVPEFQEIVTQDPRWTGETWAFGVHVIFSSFFVIFFGIIVVFGILAGALWSCQDRCGSDPLSLLQHGPPVAFHFCQVPTGSLEKVYMWSLVNLICHCLGGYRIRDSILGFKFIWSCGKKLWSSISGLLNCFGSFYMEILEYRFGLDKILNEF